MIGVDISIDSFDFVHGEYAGHYSEFMGMGASHWKPLFTSAGLETAGRIHGLPAHSPYRFGLEAPRRVLSKLGVASCNGYVLRKAGRLSDLAALVVSRNGHERRVERKAGDVDSFALQLGTALSGAQLRRDS